MLQMQKEDGERTKRGDQGQGHWQVGGEAQTSKIYTMREAEGGKFPMDHAEGEEQANLFAKALHPNPPCLCTPFSTMLPSTWIWSVWICGP